MSLAYVRFVPAVKDYFSGLDNFLAEPYFLFPMSNDMLPSEDRNYLTRQQALDREYLAAWKNAPPEFKALAAAAGLKPHIDDKGMSLEFQDGYLNTSTRPDMAKALDSFTDELVEKIGHEEVTRLISAAYARLLDIETERNRATLLARIAGTLIETAAKNMQATLHGLLHAVPRMAMASGYPSLRSSARKCGCSAEWLRKFRDDWCQQLSLPVPTEGQKTPEAKKKYRDNGNTNHWREQRCTKANLRKLIV